MDLYRIVSGNGSFFPETALEVSEFKIAGTADETGEFALIVAFAQGRESHSINMDLKRSLTEKVL